MEHEIFQANIQKLCKVFGALNVTILYKVILRGNSYFTFVIIKMKQIGIYISLMFLTSFIVFDNINASPQLSDYLVYKGDTSFCYNLLLESYFENTNTEDEGKLFDLSFRKGASLNCWRGYQAVYTILNDEIYLTDIIDCGELYFGKSIDKKASLKRMTKIFGDKVVGQKVPITWFNGILSIPGDEVLRWDGVFYKIHMKEKLISINRSKVIGIKEVANYVDHPDHIDRRDRDSLPSILFKEILKEKWKSKFDCSERFNITINNEGKIDKIVMIDYPIQTDIEEAWNMKEYNYCIKKLECTFKDLKFDVLKDKGVPISEVVFLELWFDEDGRIENWTD